MLPLQARLKIAALLRARSKRYVKSLNATSMDVVVKSLVAMMRHYKVEQLIHGHTHQPAIHYLHLASKPSWRYVLSDWHNTATALVCAPSAPPQLLPAL
jgi:UDP-2,3-diacylglucosamine hydrolase